MEDNSKLPEYETAHSKIKGEARKQVMAHAERLAKEFQEKKDGEVVEIEEIEEEAAEKETD